ncbi:MAG: septum formation initiator family protein [Fusobacterium sp.]|nr:septum formation initiator family protein [Fusobacterium sp.]
MDKKKRTKVFDKIKKIGKKNSAKPHEKIYYSGLTLFLLFALIQVGWSVLINFSKVVAFNGKISDLERLKNISAARNEQLKNEIKAYSQVSQLEGIARNSLKMASEDEVLILINEQQAEDLQENKQE